MTTPGHSPPRSKKESSAASSVLTAGSIVAGLAPAGTTRSRRVDTSVDEIEEPAHDQASYAYDADDAATPERQARDRVVHAKRQERHEAKRARAEAKQEARRDRAQARQARHDSKQRARAERSEAREAAAAAKTQARADRLAAKVAARMDTETAEQSSAEVVRQDPTGAPEPEPQPAAPSDEALAAVAGVADQTAQDDRADVLSGADDAAERAEARQAARQERAAVKQAARHERAAAKQAAKQERARAREQARRERRPEPREEAQEDFTADNRTSSREPAESASPPKRRERAQARAAARRERAEAKIAARRDKAAQRAAEQADRIVEPPREPKLSLGERLRRTFGTHRSDTSPDGPGEPVGATDAGSGRVIAIVAGVVGAIGLACSLILAVGALMVALNAGEGNGAYDLVASMCDRLVGPLRDVFTFSGGNADMKQSLVAWGLGSMGYLLVGLFAQSFLRSRLED